MNSLQFRLIIRLVVGAVIVLVAGILAVYLFFRANLYQQFDSSLRAEARSIAVLYVRDDDGHYEFNVPPDEERLFRHHHRSDLFCIRRLGGQPVVKSKSLRGGTCPGMEHPGTFESLNSILVSGPDGKKLHAIFVVFVPPAERGVSPDRYQIVLAAERDDVESILHHLLHLLAIVMLAAISVTALLVAWAVRHDLAPLRRLAQQARGIDAGELAKRFDVTDVPSELVPIHSALNGLLQRMEAALARERRFTADVAHELRTPVAELRSLCEVAAASGDPALATDGLRDAQAIAAEMEAIISTLLTLRRAETAVMLVPVDVVVLARQVWESIEPTAKSHGEAFSFAAPAQLICSTDRTMLSAVLRNLMENAVAYTNAGGDIECKITCDGIAIRNQPHNLQITDIIHLTSPFWRKDTARSRSAHAGLGLTLAEAYCRAMKASLSMRLEDGGWFVAEVRFTADRA